MWKRSKLINRSVVLNKQPEDTSPLLTRVENVFCNAEGEVLFHAPDLQRYVILKDYPTLTIVCNGLPEVAGTYAFLPNNNSQYAIYKKEGMYVLVMLLTPDVNALAFSPDGNFNSVDSMISSGFLETIGELEQDFDGVIVSTTKDFSLQDYRNTNGEQIASINIFFKNAVTDKYELSSTIIDEETGYLKTIPRKALEYTVDIDQASEFSTSPTLYGEFTGTYGSRYVGWLWFRITGVYGFYRKGTDIIKTGDKWEVKYNGKTYYGNEPLRDSSTTFSIPSDEQTDPETPPIVLEYTNSKLNDFTGSMSIPNSTEVTNVRIT